MPLALFYTAKEILTGIEDIWKSHKPRVMTPTQLREVFCAHYYH